MNAIRGPKRLPISWPEQVTRFRAVVSLRCLFYWTKMKLVSSMPVVALVTP